MSLEDIMQHPETTSQVLCLCTTLYKLGTTSLHDVGASWVALLSCIFSIFLSFCRVAMSCIVQFSIIVKCLVDVELPGWCQIHSCYQVSLVSKSFFFVKCFLVAGSSFFVKCSLVANSSFRCWVCVVVRFVWMLSSCGFQVRLDAKCQYFMESLFAELSMYSFLIEANLCI